MVVFAVLPIINVGFNTKTVVFVQDNYCITVMRNEWEASSNDD